MAVTTLGGLHVEITAGNKDLKTKVKQTSDILKKGRKSLNDNAATWAKWGGAVVAASTIAAAAIFKSQAKTIDVLAKTADKLGVTTEALTGLRLAAEQTGVETRTMDMAMQRMVRRLSEAAEGGGEAKGAIEELGLSAQDLASQSPDQALKTIADAMKGVESQSDKVRLAFKFFDSEGVALVNTLALGSEGLNQFEQDAKALGIAISRVDAAKVEAANDALNIASKVIDGALQEATVQLAPLVTALAASFTDAAKEAGGMGDMIGDTIDGIVNSVGFVLDAVDGVDRVFEGLGKTVAVVALAISADMIAIAEFIVNKPVEAVNELIEALNQIPGMDLIPVSLTTFGETLKTELDLAKAAIDIGLKDIASILDRPLPSVGLKAGLEDARAAGAESELVNQKKEETAAILEDLRNRHAEEAELNAAKFEFDAESFAASLLSKQELTDFNNEQAAQKAQEHEQALEDIKRISADAQAAVVVDGLGRILGAMAANGKKGEGLYRGLAIVQTLISGQRAAVSAWAAGMEAGGPAGPAVAAAYTAASIATTGGMIARLKSGSKSNSKPSGSTPSVSGGGALGNGGNGLGSDNKRSFDITLVGSSFNVDQVRELMGMIGEQVGDGVEFNVA